VAQFFEDIERKLKFIVLHKLAVPGQKCCVLRRVPNGQGVPRTLKQRSGYLPAFDQLGVRHFISLPSIESCLVRSSSSSHSALDDRNGPAVNDWDINHLSQAGSEPLR
jgi:hypothetical protein